MAILRDVHPAVAAFELGQDIGEGPLVTGMTVLTHSMAPGPYVSSS